MKKPVIAGEWKVLFRPKKTGRYINDHSIVRDRDGAWHLFGITSFKGGATNERYFAHGYTTSLDKPMIEEWPAIDRGTLAWAPGVIKEGDVYYMFYGPSPTMLATSFDLYEWYGTPVRLHNEPIFAAHRDHFVLKVADGEWLMYVVGTKDQRGCVSLFRSNNLQDWYFIGYALTSGPDAPLHPAWGAFESPFVVKKDGKYYLFITYTDSKQATYNNTLVFVSDDPTCFGEYNDEKGGAMPIAKLNAHAPEIINVGDEWFITTCGWRGYKSVPNRGCASIAPLKWE